MRLRKTIKIDKDEYVICELTLRQIMDYFQELTTVKDKGEEEETTDTLNFFEKEIQALLDLALEGSYKVDDFMDYSPSELKELYDGFKEVNKVFFDTAAQIGVTEVLDQIRTTIQSEFSGLLVNSSKAAIARSSNTDSPTS